MAVVSSQSQELRDGTPKGGIEPWIGFGRFSLAGCRPFWGVVADGLVTSLASIEHAERPMGVAGESSSMDDWWRQWGRIVGKAESSVQRRAAAGPKHDWLPLQAVKIHAPLMPRQVFCTIANYRSGVLQSMSDQAKADNVDAAGLAAAAAQACQRRKQGEPYASAKLPGSIVGPFDTMSLPAHVEQPDWEVELGVVIGKPARHVSRERAMEHVAAYTVVNDVTVREKVSRASPQGMGTDWLAAKNAPGFLPLGPWLVPSAHVANPYDLSMTLRLNGILMQCERAGDMIFDIAEQIAYLSRQTCLLPGDLICTGSPAGFGLHYGRFLRPGDIVEAGIEGLGQQRNLCVRETRQDET